ALRFCERLLRAREVVFPATPDDTYVHPGTGNRAGCALVAASLDQIEQRLLRRCDLRARILCVDGAIDLLVGFGVSGRCQRALGHEEGDREHGGEEPGRANAWGIGVFHGMGDSARRSRPADAGAYYRMASWLLSTRRPWLG